MTATIGSILFPASPKTTAATGAVAGPVAGSTDGSPDANPFAGLLAALQASPPALRGAPTLSADGTVPSADGSSGPQADLLAGIVALTLKAQEAFEAAQSPQAQAGIMTEFVAALRARLAAVDAGEGAIALPVGTAALLGPDLAGVDAQAMQAGPVAVTRAVVAKMGLDLGSDVMSLAAARTVAFTPGAPGDPATRRGPAATTRLGQTVVMAPEGAPQPERTQARGAPLQWVGLVPPDGEAQEEAAAAILVRKEGTGPKLGAVAPQPVLDPSGFLRTVAEVGDTVLTPQPRTAPGAAEAALQTSRPGIDTLPSPALARHVAAQVGGARVSEGNTRIELTPRGLGDIEIDMRHDEAGRLRIVLKAENPAVLHAFRNDREILLDALRESGVASDGADLSFESFAGHQSRQQSEGEGWRSAVVAGGVAVSEQPPVAGRQTMSAPSLSSAHTGLDIIT